MKALTIALTTAAIALPTLGAAMTGGPDMLTKEQFYERFRDGDAIEFVVLDRDNDGLLSAQELNNIRGYGPDTGNDIELAD